MKKFKNTLLSVLLFSFAFLAVHDYMMAEVCISSYQEQALNKVSALSEPTSKSLTAVSYLHDSIHTMIFTDTYGMLSASLIADNKPSYVKLGFATNNNFVLERPPLS